MNRHEGHAAPGALPAHTAGEGQIVIEGLHASIADRRGRRTELIRDCTFSIRRGRFTVLVGPSGCGKTTLMNLIAGYVEPDAGRILIDGAEVSGPGWDRLMVFQETALFPWMTTLQNVMYGPTVRRAEPRASIERRARDLIERFGLREFADRYPAELSGGMQRRAELARALINDPLAMLMDEPFRGLDAMTRQLMQEYLVKLFEETRKTMVFVTSEIDEAIFLADDLIVLSRAPARVATRMTVDLPRPRHFEMLASERYGELKGAALELLYKEAAAAFDTRGGDADLRESYETRFGR